MQRTTPTARPGAIALAGLLTALTAWITLRDVASVSDLTPAHMLTLAAIALAVYTGHTAVPLLAQRRIAAGLAALGIAIASTGYVAAIAGIRNTAVVAATAQRIDEANAARKRADSDLGKARELLAELEAEEKAECKRVGPQCDRKTARTAAGRTNVSVAEKTRTLHGAIETPGAAYDGLAQILSLVPGVTGSRQAIRDHLIIALPWLAVVIAELGTVLCWSIGLPSSASRAGRAPAGAAIAVRQSARALNGAVTAHSFPNPDTLTPAEIEDARRVLRPVTNYPEIPDSSLITAAPNRSANGSGTDTITAYILTEIALGRSIPSQQGIAERFGAAKSTVSDLLADLELSGMIARHREGRRMVISAPR